MYEWHDQPRHMDHSPELNKDRRRVSDHETEVNSFLDQSVFAPLE